VSILKKIGPWIASAALCLLAVEALGAARFYWSTNKIVYFNQPKAVASEPAAALVYKRHLHPYFGYTGPYSRRGPMVTPTNNLGFIDVQQREVPFRPEPNDFVVFVFGGSVASRLTNNSTHARPSLQEALQKIPELAGKNIVLYNMAQGPGKQPQQLMELAFLIASGQHIDLALNLDGTLEFASGMTNFSLGVDPIFPPMDILLAIGNELAPQIASSAEYYELAYEVTHARAESARYLRLLENSTSGVAYIKNRIFKAIYDRSLEKNLSVYNQTIAKVGGWTSVREVLGVNAPINIPKENVIEHLFDIWIRSSDLMKAMASSTGAVYLNIVVPSPYYSKKALTESERAFFKVSMLETFRQANAAGYALIQTRAEMLKSRNIVSGIALFDDVRETTFADGSGHLVELGEAMLTKFVAEQAALRLGSPQGKPAGPLH
jgi:hypothetical protein